MVVNMKKFLITLIILFWSNQLIAGDYYLKGATPATLMEMGFKLVEVTPMPESSYYDVIYTFVKDKNIASCKVALETRSRGRPYEKHKCYNVTNIEN